MCCSLGGWRGICLAGSPGASSLCLRVPEETSGRQKMSWKNQQQLLIGPRNLFGISPVSLSSQFTVTRAEPRMLEKIKIFSLYRTKKKKLCYFSKGAKQRIVSHYSLYCFLINCLKTRLKNYAVIKYPRSEDQNGRNGFDYFIYNLV